MAEANWDGGVQGTTPAMTIPALLEAQVRRFPRRVAIAAPGRTALTYAGLYAQVRQVVCTLNGMGLGRGDRIATVLGNGPDMAVAFLAVAAAATCAPLNPDYRAEELDFSLSDLKARAVIVQSGVDTPARQVAAAHGIPVIELCVPDGADAGAGLFTLAGAAAWAAPAWPATFAESDDIALALHTSGTTSRPKLVPLTQRNLCSSAFNIGRVLELVETDRCLNVMPLFHIHGLIGAVLSSLAAGAEVVCTPGCLAPRFFGWLEEFQPTWYTAVPTMHQSILARAAREPQTSGRCPLRFVRSSSASLPPQVLEELEALFHCPVIEAYGMTEGSHQIASNPLPPRPRKAGSVGVAAGPQVAVLDEAGRPLPPGERGEVAIRGDSVTSGYESHPAANEATFTDGWLRTGDQGLLDADGYLFLTGRLKELINRGGEKISPREVDEALLQHPAVAQAVTFAVPDPRLGEEVGAALVLRENASATQQEINTFVASRLTDFKVPRHIVFLKEIPKGPTGKLQRIGLAEKLGVTASHVTGGGGAAQASSVAPRTAMEAELAEMWKRILGLQRLGIRDSFFDLGGDSLLGLQMLLEVEARWGKRIRVSTLCLASTIEQVAAIVQATGPQAAGGCLVPIRADGGHTPLFCIHGIYGDVLCFRGLAHHLGQDRPVYGVQPPDPSGSGPVPTSIPAMAQRYLEEIRSVQPSGPYLLSGLSFGGLVAFEIARQLHAQGQAVKLLALLDTNGPNYKPLHRLRGHWRKLLSLRGRERISYLRSRAGGWLQKGEGVVRTWMHLPASDSKPLWSSAASTILAINRRASMAYRPQPYPGRMVLFRASEREAFFEDDPLSWWGGLVTGGLEVHDLPGTHDEILHEPCVRHLADGLRQHLAH